MATEGLVKELEKEITCAICHGHYTEPKVLPCCHYYCKQCLHQLTLRTGIDKPFSCPECRKDTTLPEGGLDNLPTAFFVNRMKEVHSKLELARAKVDVDCEMCLQNKAEAFCRQCAKFICADCVQSHQKMKAVFCGHKVSTLDELREGGAEYNTVIQEPSYRLCKVHKQPMNMYCYDCKSLICRDCTIRLHRNHRFEFVNVAAPKIKRKLVQQLGPLRESKSNMLRAMDSIYTTISEVEDQGWSVAEHIESSFAKLHNVIDSRKQQLLAETTSKVKRKSMRLSEQEEGLSNACVAIESMIDYTEQCVEHSADDEIMCMHAFIKSRINREIEEQQKERKDLEPVEEVDLGVQLNCAQDLCQSEAITKFVTDYSITVEGLKPAEVNKTSQFEVQTHLSNGRPTKRSCAVRCSLKSLANVSTTECQVQLITGNRYRIQYTPTVRGRHELIVTVNGQKVAGSPFPVFVSIHPTLLGKPVRVITGPGLDGPREVVVTTTGDIIVMGSRKIVIFDKKGKMSIMDLAQYGISNPYGVAVDSNDGCIFITEDSTITKLSPDYKLIGKFSGDEYSSLVSLAIVGDEVMVAELESDVVMVYSKDLNYVRQFGSYGSGPGQLRDISSLSSDENGNCYVSDGVNRCVHLFSNSGEFLHSFGHQSFGHQISHGLNGICVAGQYLYVVDYGDQSAYGGRSVPSVSVFTTEGEFVTLLTEGDFSCPREVCVDMDGFVYVCDETNGTIQIF